MMGLRALAWIVAVLASLAVHLAFAAILVESQEQPMIAGGGEPAVVVLGSAFEDMAVAGAPSPTVSPDAEAPDVNGPDSAEPQVLSPAAATGEAVQEAPVEAISPRTDRLAPVAPSQAAAADAPQETAEAVRAERLDPAMPVVVAALEPADAPSREEVVADQSASTLEAEPAEAVEQSLAAGQVQPREARESVAPQEPAIETVKPVEPPLDTVQPVEEPAETVRPVEEPVAHPLPPAPRETREAAKPARQPPGQTLSQAPSQVPGQTKDKPVRRKAKRPPASSGGGGKSDRDVRRGSESQQAANGAAGQSASRRAGTPGNAAVSNYPGLVAGKLRRSLRYPSQAKRQRLRGEVHVSFVVSKQGSAGSVRIARSSGNAILDSAALETVRRAAPFPAIPDAAGKSSWPFTVPLAFTR